MLTKQVKSYEEITDWYWDETGKQFTVVYNPTGKPPAWLQNDQVRLSPRSSWRYTGTLDESDWDSFSFALARRPLPGDPHLEKTTHWFQDLQTRERYAVIALVTGHRPMWLEPTDEVRFVPNDPWAEVESIPRSVWQNYLAFAIKQRPNYN